MIKQIKINKYKKFSDIVFDFETGINAISGENGTCKSSLLYLIGNSFQGISTSCNWINDKKAISVINAINSMVNPKVEKLQRGDKKYNDPAPNVKGALYTVSFYGHEELSFRRHNSASEMRYCLKPYYPKGQSQKLPACPVVYLGLSRLVPYGEFQKDDEIKVIKQSIPVDVKKRIADNFQKFTLYDISHNEFQKMGDLKNRSDFTSDKEGIDSNTISAGEDNLYVILAALESLRFYFESINSTKDIESVLLIDEVDATLHPSYQVRLLALFREYAEKYKIQIVFTTHSMTTIKDLLESHDNLIYLVDNVTDIAKMEEPTIQNIQAHLYRKSKNDIYRDKHIPIFTEDREARILLHLLFDFLEQTKPEFRDVRRFFTIPEINIGADILHGLFKEEKLIRSHVGAFCVLDGDHEDELDNCIITLPGKNSGVKGNSLSPEALLQQYAQALIERDSQFWKDKDVLDKNFGKKWYLENIKAAIDEYEATVKTQSFDTDENNANRQKSEKRRQFNKELFNKHQQFFEYLFKYWLHDQYNQRIIESFYENLKIMFKKCASMREINPEEWK